MSSSVVSRDARAVEVEAVQQAGCGSLWCVHADQRGSSESLKKRRNMFLGSIALWSLGLARRAIASKYV
jgi:hypothetical protein